MLCIMLEHLSPKPNDHILDLGCGTGRLATVLAERVGSEGKVVAVDPDVARIELAKESKSNENIQFIVGNDISFPPALGAEGYDIVTCTDVLHWIEDKETTFKRVFANLKPGGQFGFTTVQSGLPELALKIVHISGGTVEQKYYYISSHGYEELAKSVGFEVTFIESRSREVKVPNIDFYIDLFYSILHGSFDKNHSALDELRNEYKKEPIIDTLDRLTAVLTKPLLN